MDNVEKFHPERLIACLNARGIKVSRTEYYKDWNVPMTQAAVGRAGLSTEEENWIWKKKYDKPTMVWDR